MTILVAAPLLAFTPAGSADACYVEYPAREVDTPVATLYEAQFAGNRFVETGIFLETNQLPGLQITSDQACGGPHDQLLASACPNVSRTLPGLVILCLVDVE